MKAFLALLGLGAIALGGPSNRKLAEERTFYGDIEPVMRAKCTPCHRDGGVGPFPLETLAQVKSRATLIQTVAMQSKMPPADALSDLGKLRKYEKLTDSELFRFQEWVNQKTQAGKPHPIPKVIATDWEMGKPDLIIYAKDMPKIRAEAVPYSPELRIPLNLDKTRILRALDIRPTSPSAWRRALIAKAYPIKDRRDVFLGTGIDASRLVGSWGLGGLPWKLPAGSGVKLEPSDELVVSPLWQPTGKTESGDFEIGLYFDDAALATPNWLTLGKRDFVLPPQDSFTTLTSELTVETDADVVSFAPEARLYGRMIRLIATPPDGVEKVLFFVFNWDSEWANSYVLDRAVTVKKGTKLTFEMTYDNSGHAFGNDRVIPAEVKFGPGARDELCWLHVQIVPKSG
ncbi:MAG: hypothetical protein ABL949_10670 [Fimbriimonadaceae bacterium]